MTYSPASENVAVVSRAAGSAKVTVPGLPGFTGVGSSIEDCVEKARTGIEEHVALVLEQDLPVPEPSADPTITVHNQRALADASGF